MGYPLAITQASYRDKQVAEHHVESIATQLAKDASFTLKNVISYGAYFGDKREDEDAFSFQMSFLLPSWPVRFQDTNFRRQFDNIVYENAPAHIVFASYWLDPGEMRSFEKLYFGWIRAMEDERLEKDRIELSHKLLKKIEKYKEVQKK